MLFSEGDGRSETGADDGMALIRVRGNDALLAGRCADATVLKLNVER